MESYPWFLLLHILLLVFWLGTDLGVFAAAKMSERSDLTVETRMNLMQLGMVLDRLPRTMLILILPSGLVLADGLGVLAVTDGQLTLAWVGALIWAGLMWAGFLNPQTKMEQTAHLINLALQALLVLVLAYVVMRLWGGSTPLWVNLKLVILAAVFAIGIALDLQFRPAVVAFTDILTNGASPERDALYRQKIAPVYWWVIAIYLLVLAAAALGVLKPAG